MGLRIAATAIITGDVVVINKRPVRIQAVTAPKFGDTITVDYIDLEMNHGVKVLRLTDRLTVPR